VNFGIIIGRIGGVDGVALETEKWISVLLQMGHKIHVFCGELEKELSLDCTITLFEKAAFGSETCLWEQENVFLNPQKEDREIETTLQENVESIEDALLGWLKEKQIECILTENATTLPFHLSLGIASCNVIAKTGLPAIAHDHDFYWERGDRYKTPYSKVQEELQRCFPPNLENLSHAVINHYSQEELKKRGIDSIVVPNVMDFDQEFAPVDDYNSELLETLGIDSSKDIALFQITRIVKRKGIETAIELISKLERSNVHLVLTGRRTDDEGGAYTDFLIGYTRKLGLEDQVHFAGESFDNFRMLEEVSKIYSLEDAYAHADAMTYFSTYEGFGNAFVEAVLARLPIFVNNYKPVYWPEIGSLGFQTVQIEDSILDEKSLVEIQKVLNDKSLREDMTARNFEIGRRHLSFQVLREKLEILMGDL